ncbi:23348_t:CDS:2, partial [Dentiscutata erythropus]
DFEYDKTLNYENGGNGKRRMSYEENETEREESENIKRARFDKSCGIFSDESVVDDWYKAVLELSKKNPSEVKYSIEKVFREWYTLSHSDHIIHITRNAPENELKEFKGKCFWLLMDNVGGRHIPLINNFGRSGGGNSGINNPGSNSGSSPSLSI